MREASLLWALHALLAVAAVKVKVLVRSDEADSRPDEAADERAEPWPRRLQADGAHPQHPNEMIFSLIYSQAHVSSAFKFTERWYTWGTERRTDGSNSTNYYVCPDDPKRCDEIGWERTEALPRCAFQIESLLSEDRACVSAFGRARAGSACDDSHQMKISEMLRLCGARIRSLWRFVRVGRRPGAAAKPADVNSLLCEDEEECSINIEYRIHHDRITFSLHEPTRGQTFKSALKRDVVAEEPRARHRRKRPRAPPPAPRARFPLEPRRPRSRPRQRAKPDGYYSEGKGIAKERNHSGYSRRNNIQIHDDDVSENTSE